MAYASLADLVAAFENPSRDPTLLNGRYDARHTASGLFQITNETWAGFGGYPSAASAPVDVQYAQFGQLVGQRGLQPWTCPGCDPALSAYVANHPDVMSLPVTTDPGASSGASSGADATGANQYIGGGSPSGLLGNGQGWFGTNIGAPAPGSPQAVQGSSLPGGGQPGSLGKAATGWVDSFTGWLGHVAGRVGLFALAIVFIIGALILFGIKSGISIQQGAPA